MCIVYLLTHPPKSIDFGFFHCVRNRLTAEFVFCLGSECVWFIPGTFAQMEADYA